MPLDKVEKMRSWLLEQSISIDKPVGDDEGRVLGEVLEDPDREDVVPDRGPRVGGPDDRGPRPAPRAAADRGRHPAPALRPGHRAGADPQGDRRQVQPVPRAHPAAPGAGPGQDAPRAGSPRPDVIGVSDRPQARKFGYVLAMSRAPCRPAVCRSSSSLRSPRAASKDTKLKVTGIEPEKGDVEGGTYVRIKGNRFIADGARNAKVYFGSRAGHGRPLRERQRADRRGAGRQAERDRRRADHLRAGRRAEDRRTASRSSRRTTTGPSVDRPRHRARRRSPERSPVAFALRPTRSSAGTAAGRAARTSRARRRARR